jgi:spore coat polysaccharide biosynthesis protein SpsF (cytidylyltransferase family)
MLAGIVQARMGSTRLPGKVLMPLGGGPAGEKRAVLACVVERLRRVPAFDSVMVATSELPADDAVVALCAQIGVPCHRGSESDVLDRFHGAASRVGASAVVRITADCPLLDPAVVQRVVDEFTVAAGAADYVSNINPPTYPDGLDCEVFSFAALERAWKEARLRSEREHVTLYIRNHPELFAIRNVANDHDLSALRWVVDEPADLEVARAVYSHFGEAPFGMDDVLRFFASQPELAGINAAFTRDEGLLRSLREDGYIA